MKISLNWLREFVDAPAEPHELKTALTGAGLAVESLSPVHGDTVFEIEVTSNRPDCLSHVGVAREVAALYGKPLKQPQARVQESSTPALSAISIQISDPELCARYCGRVIRNVKVQPSPAWLAKRLESVGVRSINNIADVTNYVLMELGQPLHAFDLARLRHSEIEVRRARAGEHLRTLDGVDRALNADNLVIADGRSAVALAGVMGGKESEIADMTSSVMLESAWFEPASVRQTAKFHAMHTEASHHFERGADIEMAPFAADRAAAMIVEVAGGEVLRGLVDVYPRRISHRELTFRSAEIGRILGTEVPVELVERILRSLGFETRPKEGCSWRVIVPSWRPDVAREIDLVEEIARIYGYENLRSRIRSAPPEVERDTRREKELSISSVLVSLGYRECILNPMIDPTGFECFTDQRPVPLLNPLSQESAALRSTPVPGMLRALRWNLDRGQMELRLFEMGKTYTPDTPPNSSPLAGPGADPSRDDRAPSDGRPEERGVLALAVSGHRRLPSVHDTEKPLDFFDLKGDLETLFEAFELQQLSFETADVRYLEPGLTGRFLAAGQVLAVLGRLSPEIGHDYKLKQPVWLAELDFDLLMRYALRPRRFAPYPRFPSVERDFSLIVPDGIAYRDIADAISRRSLDLVAFVRPLELFRGGSVPEHCYSLLLHANFHSLSHTLTSQEVDEASRQLLAAVEQLGVRLRA